MPFWYKQGEVLSPASVTWKPITCEHRLIWLMSLWHYPPNKIGVDVQRKEMQNFLIPNMSF